MAELLVRVVDKVNEDFYLNCQCTKRGDVIVAVPDGWLWGKEELRDPQYRIIVMPGLSLGDAQSMTAPEFDKDPNTPSKTLKRRAFRLDLDALATTKAIADYLADASRTQPSIKLVELVKDEGTFDVPVTVEVQKDVKGEAILSDGKLQPITEQKEQVAVAVPVADFLALKIEKPATSDPNVIGVENSVIG